MKRILKRVVIALIVVVVAIQFYRPARSNPPYVSSQAIDSNTRITVQVQAIFKHSCNDCHSNATVWPWYSNVAPVSWFVIDHVNEGRRVMNLSEWGRHDTDWQSRRLRQICNEVQDGAMPLNSYTPMHPGSKLSAEDKKTLCDWTNAERTRLATQ